MQLTHPSTLPTDELIAGLRDVRASLDSMDVATLGDDCDPGSDRRQRHIRGAAQLIELELARRNHCVRCLSPLPTPAVHECAAPTARPAVATTRRDFAYMDPDSMHSRLRRARRMRKLIRRVVDALLSAPFKKRRWARPLPGESDLHDRGERT